MGSTLPVITVAATDADAAETATGVTPNPGAFTLTRTGSTTSALTVNIQMSGTATNGTDYSNIATTATFAAGSATAVVNLNVIDDTLIEGTETATLTVTSGTGYTIGTGNSATVNIADNDFPVITVAATDADAAETATGVTPNPGAFTLTRTGPTTSALTVNIQMSGTATNGTDYSNIATTATFAAGSAIAVVNLNVIDDTSIEGTETATLTVTSGTGYTIGTGNSATVNIADNDFPVITVAATDADAAETATGVTPNPGAFTLTRTGPTTSALTVNIQMSGTATNGTDYSTIATTVTFAAGSATAVVNLNVIDDTLIEGTETATLTVIAGNGYTLNSLVTSNSAASQTNVITSSATVSITDNDTPSGTITLNAVDTGWYDSTGLHESINTNYIAGDSNTTDGKLYRNWFAFNLPTLNAPIVSAQLKLKTFDYDSPSPSETYELREVTTAVPTLTAGGSGKTTIYNDLGDGVIYGSRVYANADDNLHRTIDLNAAAISAVTAKKWSSLRPRRIADNSGYC